MNKKITIIGCVVLFMLVTIPLVSAITQNTDIEKKDSPLYGIRAKRATGEKISKIFEKIKARFLEERVFYLPFQKLLTGKKLLTTESPCITYYDSKMCTSSGVHCRVTAKGLHSICEWCTISKWYCT
jgi:hypothetical protein